MLDGAKWIERTYRFRNLRVAFAFVERSAALAKTDGHHPEIAFGWGIRHDLDAHQEDKGLHGKDSIMAAMLDRIVAERAIASDSPEPLRPAQQR